MLSLNGRIRRGGDRRGLLTSAGRPAIGWGCWLTIAGANALSERAGARARLAGTAFRRCSRCCTHRLAARAAGGRYVPDTGVGRGRDAAADGHLFSAVHAAEDAGYLPRVAYNPRPAFHACRACGKQALTMCMGLGCNAAGVVGCRIIDSERERLLAVLTNSLMPCNGWFPALIALHDHVLYRGSGGSPVSALLLTAALVLSVGLTFGATLRLRNCDRAARQAVGFHAGAAAVPRRRSGRSSCAPCSTGRCSCFARSRRTRRPE